MEVNINNLSVTYNIGTSLEVKALDDVNLNIPEGRLTTIIGVTGSGKSTLAKAIAGLIEIQKGNIQIANYKVNKNNKITQEIRRKIGITFQYPEQQLFAETVEKDISFAAINFGYTQKELINALKRAFNLVNLSYEDYANKSPFNLSGGEMRKVAIAGTLIYQPKLIIFDEPTVGLDYSNKKDIINLIKKLSNQETTIVYITHDLKDILLLTDKIVLLENGKVKSEILKDEIHNNVEQLKRFNIEIPDILKFITKLNKKLHNPISIDDMTLDKLEIELIKRIEGIQ